MTSKFAIFIGVLLTGHVSAEIKYPNLILRIWGGNQSLLQARVRAAAQAVSADGKLILDYSRVGDAAQDLSIEPQKILANLPAGLRAKVLLVKSNDNYSFPRDTSRGWGQTRDGHYRLYGNKSGNRVTGPDGKSYDSYSTLGIASLLSACEGDEFALPIVSRFSAQGGEIVGNGQGTCIVNADILKTDKVTKDFEDHLVDLGCQQVIEAPSIHQMRELGLMNGHVDLSASFIGPQTVMIPTLNPSCAADQKLQEIWTKFKAQLVAKKIEVIELTVGGGCAESNAEFASGQPGSRYLRSYSNAVVLEEAILLPQFTGGSETQAERLATDNLNAQNKLKQLMAEKKIPRRRVVGFALDDGPVKGGGEVRCMTLEVPGHLTNCTQARLDRVISRQISQADHLADCLKTNFDAKLCRTSQQMVETLMFLQREPEHQRVLTTPDGVMIRILNSSRDLLGAAIEKLKIALKSCSA